MKYFWKYYSFLFLFLASNNAIQLLNKDSVIGVYYNTTIVFSNWFIIPYFLNILNALITCIVGLLIIDYAFDTHKLPKAPQWLFYARLISDCTGHSYDFKTLQAGFYQGKIWGLIGIASMILPILPSYLVHWRMSFKK